MKTLAVLLILVALAASRRSHTALLWGQPHTWLSVSVDFLTRCISR